jgi:hypothetical protein
MAKKLGRSAISKCLEEIDAAMKNGTVGAARKYRGELEPAARHCGAAPSKPIAVYRCFTRPDDCGHSISRISRADRPLPKFVPGKNRVSVTVIGLPRWLPDKGRKNTMLTRRRLRLAQSARASLRQTARHKAHRLPQRLE